MSEQKFKPVDFDVLIDSGLFVKSPDGYMVKLDDDCPITVWELEDHRYEPLTFEWYVTEFVGGSEFLDKLREAGFGVCENGDNFYISGPSQGYCWPWQTQEKVKEDIEGKSYILRSLQNKDSHRMRMLLEQEKDDNLSLVRQRDSLRDLLIIAMYMVDRECADILRRQAQLMGVSLTEEK